MRFIKKPVAGFIGGLGGRDITRKEVLDIIDKLRKNKEGTEWVGSKL